MTYFIDPQGNYPRHIGDVQVVDPNYVQGNDLPEGWQEVAPGIIPELKQGETFEELAPKKINGVLTRQFKIVPLEVIDERAKAEQVLLLNGFSPEQVASFLVSI
jgi:hypothetical protein